MFTEARCVVRVPRTVWVLNDTVIASFQFPVELFTKLPSYYMYIRISVPFHVLGINYSCCSCKIKSLLTFNFSQSFNERP